MAEQNVPDDRVALIDLDGTVADYEKSILWWLNEIRGPMELPLESLPYSNMPVWLSNRVDLIKRQPGFWRDLPSILTGLQICNLLANRLSFRLMVLTKGPKRTISAWSEKVEWVQRHLPGADVTVTHDKGLVYGKILFDDYPPYVEQWLAHRPRGRVLMFETPYNKEFSHPNVLKIPQAAFMTGAQEEQIVEFLGQISRSNG